MASSTTEVTCPVCGEKVADRKKLSSHKQTQSCQGTAHAYALTQKGYAEVKGVAKFVIPSGYRRYIVAVRWRDGSWGTPGRGIEGTLAEAWIADILPTMAAIAQVTSENASIREPVIKAWLDLLREDETARNYALTTHLAICEDRQFHAMPDTNEGLAYNALFYRWYHDVRTTLDLPSLEEGAFTPVDIAKREAEKYAEYARPRNRRRRRREAAEKQLKLQFAA